MTRYRVSVIGEICVDIRATLPISLDTLLSAGPAHYGSLDLDVGGTAVNFARVAPSDRLDVVAIGKVGADYLARFVEDQVSQLPGTYLLIVHADHATKVVASVQGTLLPNAPFNRIMIASGTALTAST